MRYPLIGRCPYCNESIVLFHVRSWLVFLLSMVGALLAGLVAYFFLEILP